MYCNIMTKYWASHVTFCCHTLVQRIDLAAALTFAPGLLYTPCRNFINESDRITVPATVRD